VSDNNSSSGDQPTQGEDLSDGLLNYHSDAEKRAVAAFIDEVVVIRQMRIGVAGVLVAVLAVLVVALLVTICSFNKQIDRVTPEIKHRVETAKSGDSLPTNSAKSMETTRTIKPAERSPTAASAASEPPLASTPDAPTVTTSVKVDIASMAGSVVAVISILVVAVSVIAISLMQATFKLTPHRSEEAKDGAKKGGDAKDTAKKDEPGELPPFPLKELGKQVYECLKPFFGKDEK